MHFTKPWVLFFLLMLLPHPSQAAGLLVSGAAYYSGEYLADHPDDCSSGEHVRAGCPVEGIKEVIFNIYRGEKQSDGRYQCNDEQASGTSSVGVDYALVEKKAEVTQNVEFAEGTIETIEEFVGGTKVIETFLVGAGIFSAHVEIDDEILLSYADYGDNAESLEATKGVLANLCIGMAIDGDEEMVPRVQYNPVPFASLAEKAISLVSNGEPQLIDSQLALGTTPPSAEVEDASLLIQSDVYVTDTTDSPFLMALQTVVPHPTNPEKAPKIVDVLTVKTDGSTSLSGNLFLTGGVNGFMDLGLSSLVVGTGTALATLDYNELGFLDGATSNLQTQINNLSVDGGNPFGLTIESSEIVDSTITKDDIALNTIVAADIATDAVTTTEILDDTIVTADIAADTITAADIATGAVGTAKILDGTIIAADIADGTITAADIATDTVTAADIAASAVGTAEILDGTVLAIDIATGGVDTAEIVDNSVTAADLAATITLASGDLFDYSAAIGDGKGLRLPQGTDTPPNVGNVEGFLFLDTDDNIIKFSDSDGTWVSVTGGSGNPFGSAIDSSEITDGTVASADIAVDTIAAVDIASSAVTTAEIADGTIAANDIGADVIVSGNIATGAITAAEMPDTLCLDTHSVEINPTEAGGNNDFINLLDNTFSTTEANEDQFMTAINGYANNFIVTTNVAPDNGPGTQSWVVMLRNNGTDTALTCTVSEVATGCGASGATQLLAAGAKLDIQVTTSGSSPVATSALNVAFCLGQ